MKNRCLVVLASLTVVAVSLGCSGADEVTGPQLPELMPKKEPQRPPDSRTQPVVVEGSRATVETSARPRAAPDPPLSPTPRVPPCWKNTGTCPTD